MSELTKEAFVQIVTDIVAGFEAPGFQRAFADAKNNSDVAEMMRLPLEIQNNAFAKHGLDGHSGPSIFKAAGKGFAADPEVMPLLVRMKAAL
ncbi:MAG TPA: hypothetical protein DCQ06_05735 [Myxococcales bacterium]|nr:hypothetical protein [Myxococcales bacterium]